MPRNKLSRYRQRKIVFCFSHELTATQTAEMLKINRNTVNRYYRLVREKIAAYEEQQMRSFAGEVELDESYFGGYHKGHIGRSVKSKIPVFGILKRNGKVYTQIVPDVSARTLKAIVKQRVRHGSIVFSDSWCSYDGLVFDGYEHIRINHTTVLVEHKRNHINGIESFWSYTKNKLSKFYGIRAHNFYLYLKEYEFRFNHRSTNLELLITKIFFKT